MAQRCPLLCLPEPSGRGLGRNHAFMPKARANVSLLSFVSPFCLCGLDLTSIRGPGPQPDSRYRNEHERSYFFLSMIAFLIHLGIQSLANDVDILRSHLKALFEWWRNVTVDFGLSIHSPFRCFFESLWSWGWGLARRRRPRLRVPKTLKRVWQFSTDCPDIAVVFQEVYFVQRERW